MKSRASAPGKVILFGEHFVIYGVPAILCAINRRITVTAENTDGGISIRSYAGNLDMESGAISDVDPSLRPLYHIADKMIGGSNSGVSITVESDIPQGVGLGSSSACCVAGAAAVSGLFGDHTREQILKLAIDAERTIFSETSGADCTISTYGGIIRYDRDGFDRIGLRQDFDIIIANSEIEHSTREVATGVKKFKDENGSEFARLCDAESELVASALKMLERNDIACLGDSMSQNQQYLEMIGVSNDILDGMVRTGQRVSFGAKITGAGGGGCIIALVDGSNRDSAIKGMNAAGYRCFSAGIDRTGLDTF